jgi:hypothetical protein
VAALVAEAAAGEPLLAASIPLGMSKSAIGTKQTSSSTLNMSAFRDKADISDRLADVR